MFAYGFYNSEAPLCFEVGDVIRYHPRDARQHNVVGVMMKVENIRDLEASPVKKHGDGVKPSRYLLTCRTMDGVNSYYAIYDVHAEKVTAWTEFKRAVKLALT